MNHTWRMPEGRDPLHVRINKVLYRHPFLILLVLLILSAPIAGQRWHERHIALERAEAAARSPGHAYHLGLPWSEAMHLPACQKQADVEPGVITAVSRTQVKTVMDCSSQRAKQKPTPALDASRCVELWAPEGYSVFQKTPENPQSACRRTSESEQHARLLSAMTAQDPELASRLTRAFDTGTLKDHLRTCQHANDITPGRAKGVPWEAAEAVATCIDRHRTGPPRRS